MDGYTYSGGRAVMWAVLAVTLLIAIVVATGGDV